MQITPRHQDATTITRSRPDKQVLVTGSPDSFRAQDPSDAGGFFDWAKKVAKRALKGLARPKLPLYGEGDGPHDVAIERLGFRDDARDRDIPLVVYHPKDKENLEKSPVVVFSHGLAGNQYTYRYFGKHLASHGYTVLQPTHEGSDTTSFLKRPGVGIFSQRELMDRGKDVTFCLDLLEHGKLPAEVSSKVDMENVALAGHSFGALTAQAMAGVVVKDHSGLEVLVEDDRFDAYIGMSPYGDSLPTHLLGMDPETYDRIDKPLLTISGDHDRLFTGGEGPRVHRDTFNGASSKHKYHVEIDKTVHASFAQMFGLIGITAAMTNSTSLAFLDAHLKENEEAHEYLLHELPKVARSYNSDAFIGPHEKAMTEFSSP
jgi:pimeloyl-ACP methyl ester carboxylesterase